MNLTGRSGNGLGSAVYNFDNSASSNNASCSSSSSSRNSLSGSAMHNTWNNAVQSSNPNR